MRALNSVGHCEDILIAVKASKMTKQSPMPKGLVIDYTGCWLFTLSFRRGQGEAAVSVPPWGGWLAEGESGEEANPKQQALY